LSTCYRNDEKKHRKKHNVSDDTDNDLRARSLIFF
jgi:hypothetical protein